MHIELMRNRQKRAGHALIVGAGGNPAADPAYVAEMIGTVARLDGNTFDLGAEDGVNVVITKF